MLRKLVLAGIAGTAAGIGGSLFAYLKGGWRRLGRRGPGG